MRPKEAFDLRPFFFEPRGPARNLLDISENTKDENIALSDPENQEGKALKKLEKLKMALWVGALASGIDGAEATGLNIPDVTCSPSARAWKTFLAAILVGLMALMMSYVVAKIMEMVHYAGELFTAGYIGEKYEKLCCGRRLKLIGKPDIEEKNIKLFGEGG